MKRKTSNCPLCKGTGRNTLKKDDMIVRRSRSKHNAGQAKRTKRYREKLKYNLHSHRE